MHIKTDERDGALVVSVDGKVNAATAPELEALLLDRVAAGHKRLVIDLGGIAANTLQTIELDRLGWLVDGEDARIQIFYANRNKPKCNLRIETSMALRRVDPPPITDVFD